MNIQKCAIIGCGFVGATTAFSIVQSELFSEIVLIDVDKNKAHGEAMDLSHSLPFLSPMKIYAGDYSDLADCFMVIVTAGAGQKPDETRLDLVRKNAEIFKGIIPRISAVNTDCILLIVSNPVDVLTYVAHKLSGFDSRKVIGSGTVLDTARLKYLLGQQLSVDSKSVHAFIIGEHGDSELAVYSSANISGIDLHDFIDSVDKTRDEINLEKVYQDVKDSAYKIIESKGATYYGIAQAVTRICECVVKNHHSVMPVSCLLNGEYGLDDIYLGIPAIVGKNGIEKILEISLDREESDRLTKSAATLRNVLKELNI